MPMYMHVHKCVWVLYKYVFYTITWALLTRIGLQCVKAEKQDVYICLKLWLTPRPLRTPRREPARAAEGPVGSPFWLQWLEVQQQHQTRPRPRGSQFFTTNECNPCNCYYSNVTLNLPLCVLVPGTGRGPCHSGQVEGPAPDGASYSFAECLCLCKGASSCALNLESGSGFVVLSPHTSSPGSLTSQSPRAQGAPAPTACSSSLTNSHLSPCVKTASGPFLP